MTEGLMLVDKPAGWTSFDVVNYVRKIVAENEGVRPKQIKVGHTGTLDPIATGLLVLLIGKNYTKKAQDLSKLDKVYEVELKLGYSSPSFDTETPLSPVSNNKPSREELEKALRGFRGVINQAPPAYSALKVNGKRAYDLARQGIKVDLEARKIEIYSIELLEYKYPFITLNTHVTSGTYIRSLVNDLGLNLGTGAVMTKLNRLKIGNFDLGDALSVEKLNIELIKEKIKTL